MVWDSIIHSKLNFSALLCKLLIFFPLIFTALLWPLSSWSKSSWKYSSQHLTDSTLSFPADFGLPHCWHSPAAHPKSLPVNSMRIHPTPSSSLVVITLTTIRLRTGPKKPHLFHQRTSWHLHDFPSGFHHGFVLLSRPHFPGILLDHHMEESITCLRRRHPAASLSTDLLPCNSKEAVKEFNPSGVKCFFLTLLFIAVMLF